MKQFTALVSIKWLAVVALLLVFCGLCLAQVEQPPTPTKQKSASLSMVKRP